MIYFKGGNDDVYKSFNLIMRRKAKENNFKAVLETIRDLMNTKCVVPSWIQNILLGYGDPAMAHYTRMPKCERVLDFRDTFLDWQHLRRVFNSIRPFNIVYFFDNFELYQKHF